MMIDAGSIPAYVQIGAKAANLRELGMSDRSIARAIGVSDKTVAKSLRRLDADGSVETADDAPGPTTTERGREKPPDGPASLLR